MLRCSHALKEKDVIWCHLGLIFFFFFFYWSVEEQEGGKELKVFSGATIITEHEM